MYTFSFLILLWRRVLSLVDVAITCVDSDRLPASAVAWSTTVELHVSSCAVAVGDADDMLCGVTGAMCSPWTGVSVPAANCCSSCCADPENKPVAPEVAPIFLDTDAVA